MFIHQECSFLRYSYNESSNCQETSKYIYWIEYLMKLEIIWLFTSHGDHNKFIAPPPHFPGESKYFMRRTELVAGSEDNKTVIGWIVCEWVFYYTEENFFCRHFRICFYVTCIRDIERRWTLIKRSYSDYTWGVQNLKSKEIECRLWTLTIQHGWLARKL